MSVGMSTPRRTSSYVSRQIVIELRELRNYVRSHHNFIKYPPKPPWRGVGQFILGESQSRIYPHMRAKFGRGPTVVSEKKGGGSTDTQIMKLLQECQVQYCQQGVKLWW